MQRALGMDMTTPRSKSQQQIHSPSHPAKPELQSDPSTQTAPQTQTPPQPQPSAQAHPIPVPTKKAGPAGPGRQQAKLPPGAVPLPGMAKAPSQPDLSRSSPAHQPQNPRQDQTRSAGSSPSRQPPPPEQTFGKLFGFGASLLNQASTLISETTQPQQQPPKPTPKPGAPSGPGPGAVRPSGPQPAQQGPRAQAQQQQQQPSAPDSSKAKVCCPLCKTNLNIGNKSEQPNYNSCTQCHQQVCNMCGFNPTPHLVEKKEWLCLNCQTQRALSGNLGDMPAPVAQSTGSPQSAAITSQQPPQQRGPSQLSGPPPTGPQQQKKATGPQDSNKSSTQSLSDTGYSSDGISSSHGEITAYHLGQEETDWFEKPREARSDRSKHHGSGSHSSTGRRSKHTYHDYDEPPEEYGPGDEYSQQRHTSSSAQREHRHHGSSSGRHSSSRHTSEDPRSSRSSRTHPKDQTARSDGRGASSLQRRSGGDSRSAQASPRNSSDFSREADPGRHHGTGGRGQKPQGDRTTRRQDPTANGSKQQQPSQSQSGQQRSGGQGSSGRHPGSESLDAPQQAQQQHQQNAHPQQRSQTPPHNQPIPTTTAAGPVQPQQTKPGPEPSGQPGVRQPATTNAKVVTTTSAPTTGMKSSVGIPTAPPTSKITAPPLTGIGSKAVPVGIGSKAGGIGSAAAGQAPPEGENVLTKILQGGAAEQAGKLGDALSGLGKKFTSFW